MKRPPTLLHRLAEAGHILGPSLGWVAPLWLIRPNYVILARDLAGLFANLSAAISHARGSPRARSRCCWKPTRY